MKLAIVTLVHPKLGPFSEGLVSYLKKSNHSLIGYGYNVLSRDDIVPKDTDGLIVIGIGHLDTVMRNMVENARMREISVWVIENGFIGNVNNYQAVSLLHKKGVHNNNGDWLENVCMPDDRFEELGFSMKSRGKATGKRALILKQVPGDTQLDEFDIEKWYDGVKTIASQNGYSVKEREHPQIKQSNTTLYQDLSKCDIAISWNSTSIVECIRLGIPFVCSDSCQYYSMATTFKDCKAQTLGKRTQFMYNLAYCQYTPEEYRNGKAFNHMLALKKFREGNKNG